MNPQLGVTPIPAVPGDSDTKAFGINDLGQALVGSNGTYAAVFSGGQLKMIGGMTANDMFPTAITDSGWISGSRRDSSFNFHPFVCQFNGSGCAGGLKTLAPPLGGAQAHGGGINDSGVMAGTSDTTTPAVQHAFACSAPGCTSPHDVGTAGGDNSSAADISNGGIVVGTSDTTGNTESHAMRCTTAPGSCTDLGTLPNGDDSVGVAVDNANDIAVNSNVQAGNSAYHAAVCTLSGGNCSLDDLGTLPGFTYSRAQDVTNYLGGPVVVGYSGPGFLWSGGKMFSLNDLVPASSGITFYEVNSINKYRQIAATTDSGGAVMLNPKGLIGEIAFTASGIQKQSPASTQSAASPVLVQQGGTVQWVNADSASHNVVDSSGMVLFHSTTLTPGRGYAFTFNAAGTYGYKDTLHPQTGNVQVPINTAPTSGHPSTFFQIYFAAKAPPSGYVYDVQVKKPGASSFSSLLTGTKKTLTSFKPNAGTGNYSFRARIRNTANSHTSGWSPVRTISITP